MRHGPACAGWDGREGQAFRQWVAAAPTVVATTLRLLLEHGLADFGCSVVEPLPTLEPQWLAQRLAGAADDAFCAYPQRDGVVYETGALARQWTHPVLTALRTAYGTGLFTRLAARLIDAGALVTEIRQRAQTVIHDTAAGPAPAAENSQRLRSWRGGMRAGAVGALAEDRERHSQRLPDSGTYGVEFSSRRAAAARFGRPVGGGGRTGAAGGRVAGDRAGSLR